MTVVSPAALPIIIELSLVRQISRYEAVKSVMGKLGRFDYDMDLDIQIRIDGDVRTITVRRSD